MTLIKKWIILPLVVMSLLISVNINTEASTTVLLSKSSTTLQAGSLNDIQQIVEQSMKNRETDVVIKYKGSTTKLLDNISNYITKVIKDDEYLNYSYRSVNISYKAYGNDITIQLKFEYYETAEELKFVDQSVQAILAKIIKPGMNEYDKVKAVHDYVVLNLAYDTRLINNSSYPALVEGTTACNGYAMLVYKMLKKLNIEVRLISGVARSESFEPQNHAWNMVKLNGNWFHLDATWDDPIPDQQGRVLYDYFLLTDKEISKDHSWETGGINGEEKPYPVSTKPFAESDAKSTASNDLLSEFVSMGSYSNVDKNKEWIIEFDRPIDFSSIKPNNLYIVNSSNKEVASIELSLKDSNHLLVSNMNSYQAGETYYLYVMDSIKDESGKALARNVSMKFQIK